MSQVFLIHLSDGSGFCKCCGFQATLHVRAWNVKTNVDVLNDDFCLGCYLGQQVRMLLLAEQAKGQAA